MDQVEGGKVCWMEESSYECMLLGEVRSGPETWTEDLGLLEK